MLILPPKRGLMLPRRYKFDGPFLDGNFTGFFGGENYSFFNFLGVQSSTATSTTFQFTANLPPANSKRLVVALILSGSSQADSVLFNGLSGTDNGSAGAGQSLFHCVVPTGSSLTLDITTTATTTGCTVALYVIYPASSTRVDFGTDGPGTGASKTLSDIAVSAGGVLLYQGKSNLNSTSFTTTWGGADAVVEAYDAVVGATLYTATFGHILTTAASTLNDLTITRVHSGTNFPVSCISFGGP